MTCSWRPSTRQELSARLKALCARVRPVSNVSFEFLGCTFNPQQGDLPHTVFDGLASEHSRKPEDFYPLCDRILPHARHCDVFARERRPGWHAFGLEVDKFGEAA